MANVQEFLRDQLVKNEPRLCDIYYRDVLSLVSGRKIENEGVRLVSSRLNLVVGRMNAEGKKPLRKLGRLYVKIHDDLHPTIPYDGVPILSQDDLLSILFPSISCCPQLRVELTRLVGQRIYPGLADSNVVEARLEKHGPTVRSFSRNRIRSEEAAFNFIHLLSHLAVDEVYFSTIHLPHALNTVVVELIRRAAGRPFRAIHYSPLSSNDIELSTHLLHCHQISLDFFRREELTHLLNLISHRGGQRPDGRASLDCRSMLITSGALIIDDLCEIIRHFKFCELDGAWRLFGSGRQHVCYKREMSNEPSHYCSGLRFQLGVNVVADQSPLTALADHFPAPIFTQYTTCGIFCDVLELTITNTSLGKDNGVNGGGRRFFVHLKSNAFGNERSIDQMHLTFE